MSESLTSDFWFPDAWELERIKPVSGNVLIAPRETERASKWIEAPDQRVHESFIGTVIAMADDADEVELGDLVIFSPYSHRTAELHGNVLFIVHWSDIVAKLFDN